MKEYDNYFFVTEHLARNAPEDFVWKNVNSSSLAEVMEEAEKQGYKCKLKCYDESVVMEALGGERISIHRRDMVFTKGKHTRR